MSRKKRKQSVAAAIPWSVLMLGISRRYPYRMPPAVAKQRHLNEDGLDPTRFTPLCNPWTKPGERAKPAYLMH